MKSSSPRAALAVSLVVGLAAGCTPVTKAPLATPEVTAEDIENAGESIEKALQAKEPGILVTRTQNGDISIRIRGTSSFYSGNEPLYVIDDTPIEPGRGGVLTGINPHDIETIRVLKDPAETGIYGIRGANGVIVITTKRPGRQIR